MRSRRYCDRKQEKTTKVTMFFSIVLLAVGVLCVIQNQTTNPTELKLPDDLQTWCPNTKFCQDKPMTDRNKSTEKSSSGDSMQCCESCSCSPDCGLTRNCCTSEYDHYKLDETLGTVCKALSNRVHTSADETIYHMVDKCPNKDISCNTMNVSAWGSYSPVYSQESGMIYYNSECAACHNQTTIVEFIPVLSFPSFSGEYSNVFLNALNGYEDEGYLEFMIPQDIDVSTEICNPSIIGDCQRADSSLHHLEDLCHSFNATFHTWYRSYQNVYCFLCGLDEFELPSKDKWLRENTVCPERLPERQLGQLSLVVLIDESSVDNYKQSVSETEATPYACIDDGEASAGETCRKVHCPEGHFRFRGECVVFGGNWYLRNVRMFVKLTPIKHSRKLMVSDLLKLTNQDLDSAAKAFIRRPGLENWEMSLFYNSDKYSAIRYILAVLTKGSQTVKSVPFLANIQHAMSVTWKLNIKGEGFELKPSFNGFNGYQATISEVQSSGLLGRDALEYAPLKVSFNNWRFGEFRVINLTIITRLFFHSTDICITRLFFCEQVDLGPDEFVPISIGEVYLIKSRKYLGNTEFLVSADLSIRVCLSDVMNAASITLGRMSNMFLLLYSICTCTSIMNIGLQTLLNSLNSFTK